jgi:chaperonin GroES
MKKQAKKPEKSKVKTIGLTPLGDRVLVKEIKTREDKKTDSGIFIPASAKTDDGTKRGVVVAVGRGRIEDGKLIPVNLKVGDEVLYQWGENLIFKDEEYTLIKESEVFAIVG